MDLRLRQANQDDVEALCQTFFSGFAENAIAKYCFPSTSKRSWDFYRHAFADEIKDPIVHLIVVEDVAVSPPAIVAFAKWDRLSAETELPPPTAVWPPDGNPKLADEFFRTMWARHVKAMAQRPHWYLDLLATGKEYQRKGVGALLIKWGTEKADVDGWDCYLNSSPEGRGLYEKFGFRVVGTQTFINGEYIQCSMLRDKKEA